MPLVHALVCGVLGIVGILGNLRFSRPPVGDVGADDGKVFLGVFGVAGGWWEKFSWYFSSQVSTTCGARLGVTFLSRHNGWR